MATCPKCNGARKVICPDCNGTQSKICPNIGYSWHKFSPCGLCGGSDAVWCPCRFGGEGFGGGFVSCACVLAEQAEARQRESIAYQRKEAERRGKEIGDRIGKFLAGIVLIVAFYLIYLKGCGL